ncbi:MAG: peroxiredoxin [Burkholderiales bacterium]|nr:peroxiredoxin [Flavobacterium sp.]
MTLQVGDPIPYFSAVDHDGKDFESTTVVGKKFLVLYFYPKDETKVCTDQACSFRDQYQDFKDLGAEVIGISSDSVASHKKFSKRHQLPFLLLSDANKKIRKLFGVPNDLFGLIPGRVTYVADKTGKIIMIFNSMSAAIHIKKALQVLKK